ncbi:MAG: DUF3990 domain-containing protein [Clostridiales bacterium]|jgi:hypothetical protein|nr:DUF3990 domain-containing protein [Clostridiales bacterium]
MNKTILYHGSVNIVGQPIWGKGKTYNDYGLGFYCTKNLEIAREWACAYSHAGGYVNKYALDLKNLNVLDLTNEDYSVLNWIAILVNHRNFHTNSSVSKRAREFLHNNYYIDVNDYDLIVGYRADDAYFRFAKDFLNNAISIQKLSKAMQLGDLGKQVVLKSLKAFEIIKFIDYEVVDNIYYTKRVARDKLAREDYFKLTIEDENEVFLSDIMRGKTNGI